MSFISSRWLRWLEMPRLAAVALVFASFASGCLADGPAGHDGTGADGVSPSLPFAGIATIVEPAGGVGEPSLGVEPDGTLWTTGYAPVVAGRDARLVTYRSEDDGRTWTMVDPGLPNPDFDPDLAVSRDGTVWVDSLWVGCTSAAASRDSGATWTVNPLACVPVAGDRQYLVPTEGGTAYIASHERPTY